MVKRLLRHPFMRSVAIITSGTAIAQALTLTATPVLTRLFTPEAFGVLGTFTAIVTVASVVAALRLDLAIVVPVDEPPARALLVTGMAVVVATTAVTAVVGAAYVWWAAPHPVAALLAALAPLAVGASGAFQLAAQWLARTGEFSSLARANVVRATVATGFQLIGGLVAAGPGALTLGKTAGQVAASVVALRATQRRTPCLSKTAASLPMVGQSIVRYRDFTLYGTTQAFVNSVNQSLPVLLLAGLYDPASVGYYVMANRVLTLPIQLVGQSLRQVIYPRLSRDLHAGSLRRTARLATLGLATLTVPAVAVIWFAGEAGFAWVLGANWATAGVYAGYTSIWLGAAFMNIPAVASIPLLGLQRAHTLFEVAYLGARAAALVGVAASGGSALAAVVWTSWIGATFNVGLIVFVDRAAGRYRGAPERVERGRVDAVPE